MNDAFNDAMLRQNDIRLGERKQNANLMISRIENQSMKTEGERAIERTTNACRDMYAELAAINPDEWSIKALEVQKGRIEEKYKDSINSTDRYLASIDKKVTELVAGMEIPKPEDDVIHYMKMKEIREALSGMTLLDKQVYYNKAIREGDDISTEAIESSPVPYGFVNDTTKAQTRHNRLQKLFPNELKEVAQLQDAARVVRKFNELI